MTDMTVSFLFIVMLLLAFFASQYSESDKVPRSEYDAVVGQLDAAMHEITRLQQLIADLRREIHDLTEKVARRDQQIAELTEEASRLVMQLKQLQAQVASLEAGLKERDDRIAALQAEIERLKREVLSQQQQIAELQKQIQAMKRADPLESYLAVTALERRKILETIRNQLKVDFPDLKVVISEQTDALRFQGDGLFATNSAVLRPDRRAIVESLASRLSQILPCYTVGKRAAWRPECNPGSAIIEALQIEGHTDSTGNSDANLSLSTNRANSTFFTMIAKSQQLVDYLNFRGQPVMSVAGYGAMRPVSDNKTKEGRDTNRRVDLRIIMYTPANSDEIDKIKRVQRWYSPDIATL
jgi:flagellar motor protein MotB